MAFIRQYVELRAKRIVDVGCGLGMYVQQFRQFSDDVYGVDIAPDKIARASEWLPNLRVSPAEELPFDDESFDIILLNEVIEHVDDDRRAINEAFRVLAPGGHIVVYAPNRLYPFETHGYRRLGAYTTMWPPGASTRNASLMARRSSSTCSMTSLSRMMSKLSSSNGSSSAGETRRFGNHSLARAILSGAMSTP